jgi:ABC-type Na+ efflux pump permease subunit
MGEILTVARKDMRRHMRDWLAAIMWLGIPLVIGSIMILATGGAAGPKPQALLLVADEDDDILSKFLLGAMRQGGADNMIRVERVLEEGGRQRIQQGEASALLVIPKGFSRAVVRETPARLLLVTNPFQRILPNIVEELLRIVTDGAFYLHRIAGPELRAVLEGLSGEQETPSDIEVAGTAVSVNQIVRKIQRSAFPPVIELQTTVIPSKPGNAAPQYPMAFLFLPGILVMGLLFAAQGLSGDIWQERESGVLRRVVTTPLGIPRYLVGKLLAATAVLTVIALVVLVAGMAYLGLPWSRLPLALVWSVAVGVMLTSMMLAIQVFASTRRGASLLSYAVVMPLMMLGGCMFPLEIMPRWMAAVGRHTPNGWGITHLKSVLLESNGLLGFSAALALMLAISTVFLLIAVVHVHRVFARR